MPRHPRRLVLTVGLAFEAAQLLPAGCDVSDEAATHVPTPVLAALVRERLPTSTAVATRPPLDPPRTAGVAATRTPAPTRTRRSTATADPTATRTAKIVADGGRRARRGD